MAFSIGDAVLTISAKAEGLNRTLNDMDRLFNQRFGNIARKANAFAAGWNRISMGMIRGVATIGTVAAGGLAATIKAASDFESAFAGVRKTVDATEEEFGVLEQAIKTMAGEIPKSHAELARIMEIAGQLGVKGVDGLTKFTRTVADLTETTNLSIEEGAKSLAQFINVTQGSFEDADKLGSAIVKLGNNFATTEADIVAMAQRLAGAGTIAGMSQTDILAVATALSSVGINAESGGTAMSKFIIKMQGAAAGSGMGAKEAEKFAKAQGRLQKKVSDANREIQQAREKLNHYIRAGKGGSQAALSLRHRIQDLQAKLREAGAAFRELTEGAKSGGGALEVYAKVAGRSVEQMKQLILNNPAQAISEFVAGLDKVRTSGGDVEAILGALDLTEIRLADTTRRATLGNTQMTDALKLAAEAYRDNEALVAEAAQRYGTFAAKVEIAWNNIKGFAIEAGKPWLQPLKDAIDGQLIPALQRMQAWAKENEDRIRDFAEKGIARALELGGQFVEWIKGLVQYYRENTEEVNAWGERLLWLAGLVAIGGPVAVALNSFIGLLTSIYSGFSSLATVLGFTSAAGTAALAGSLGAALLGLAAVFEMFTNEERTNFIQRWIDQFDWLRGRIDTVFDQIVRLHNKIKEFADDPPWWAWMIPGVNLHLAGNKMFGGSGPPKNFLGPGSIPGLASGTAAAPRGLAMVGERGPEMVNFGGGERVFNGGDTNKILEALASLGGKMGGGGGAAEFHFHGPIMPRDFEEFVKMARARARETGALA